MHADLHLQVIRRATTRLALALLSVTFGVSMAGGAALSGFSVDAGATISRFGGGYGDAAEQSRTTPTFGASMIIGLGESLSMRPGVAWVSRGGKVDSRITITSGSDVTAFDFRQTWVVDCIDVPLLLRWESPRTSLVRPFIALGPGLSWRVATDLRDQSLVDAGPAKSNLRFANIFENIGRDDFLDLTRRFDVNAIIGAGVTLGHGHARATIDARYLHGLRDIAPPASFLSAYHRVFTLTAGVEIR